MILKGSMEINATYIKATLVENDFRTKEIVWKTRGYEVSEPFI